LSISEAEAPKVAKVPKVARRASKREITLGGLGTLGGLAADIANPIRSPSFDPDQIGRNRSYPIRRWVPADWIDGMERMRCRTCPTAINPKHWLELVKAGERVLDWGEQAAALGWSALDVFGCHPAAPYRYDCMGLVWMVTGADLKAMGPSIAALRTHSGRLITVSRSADVRERILVWDLAPGGADFSEATP
jgi:hypothetical protein